MNTWRYIQNGQTCGPIDHNTMLTLLRSGAIPADAQVCKEGNTEFVSARTLTELAAVIPAGAFAPPPPLGVPVSAPPAMDSDAADIEKNKIFGILAYIGILFLVPLLAAPQSKFARYHANQGAVLFLAAVILFFSAVIIAFIPFVGVFIAAACHFAVSIGALVLMVLGIINAANGQCKPLPGIGQFQLIK